MRIFRPTILLGLCLSAAALAQSNAPNLRILLPERTRLLQGQLVDIVLEVRNASAVSEVRVSAGTENIRFGAPVKAQLDCDDSSDWVIRADMQSFSMPGDVRLNIVVTADGSALTLDKVIQVRPFALPNDGSRRNLILFIGDAMGTSYRDAARLVSRSTLKADGTTTFRDGFFDDLLEMDKMPVSGMSMTYGTDSIVPDSANTGTAWASGNKSFLNAVNVFTDGTDCRWRFNGAANASNLPFILDNPRVENLWSYLKRRFGYRTGIVTTADVTDATPAVQGAYTGYRQTKFEIARQYLENPLLGGRPAFDVILGGGLDQFTGTVRPDRRDLSLEFQSRGYRFVRNAADLRGVRPLEPVIGLFRGSPSTNFRPASDGIRSAGDPNMDVAYDKLGFTRPASGPVANFDGYTDQPMLDLMTQKAIDVLSSFQGAPFILMVEAASIDKQSHPNQAAGVFWDAIEFDKAIGVARSWASKRATKDTLMVVTADHDQSMHIIGVNNTADDEYFNRTRKEDLTWRTARGQQNASVYGDSFANARAALPFVNTSTGASNNSGTAGMPGTHAGTTSSTEPASSTYSTYFGSPAYPVDAKSGYPANTSQNGQILRRLSVGFRTGDHTGSSVPVTAEGPGAFLFTGYMDQSDIFFKMAHAATGDTAEGDRLVDLLRDPRYPRTFGK